MDQSKILCNLIRNKASLVNTWYNMTNGILLIDIGNSCVKWGILDESIFGVNARPHHNCGISSIANDCWTAISPSRVFVSNVAGNTVAGELQEWVFATWGLAVEFLSAQAQAYGVVNAYREPSRLGSDRWAALVGAAERPHGHLCVVDCGTAITIDALSADNIHLGGLIIPGLGLMRNALLTSTAGIRYTWGTEETAFLARDTGSAVAGGSLYAVTALIDRVVADLATELCAPITVLLTGGYGASIATLLSSAVTYEADLVLHGLAVAARSFTT